MESMNAYCPACGEKVRLAVTDPPPHDGHAVLPDGSEVVCLDFGKGCSDGLCPLTARPGIVMGVRLARSHLRREDEWETIFGRCDGCGGFVELEKLDESYAYCPHCGTTNRWTVVTLEDDSGVTLTGF